MLTDDVEQQPASLGQATPVAKTNNIRGFGSPYLRGRVWWIRYHHRGRQFRESSGGERLMDAERLLKKRWKEIGRGRFIGPCEEKVLMGDLFDGVLRDHELNGRRAIATLKGRLATLRAHFGTMRALDVRAADVEAYKVARVVGKTARGTTPAVALINRELATLRRAFHLGIEQERIASAPTIKMLAGERAREGFVEPGVFEDIASALPAPLDAVARFAYATGWRKQEVLSLEWAHVDLNNGLVRLARANSKTGEPRTLVLTGALLALVEHQASQRAGSRWVFHRGGERIQSFRKVWDRACRTAGAPGLLVHDLRRSACRNMSKAGVPQAVAMKISGHKTDSMFRRYRIVDEADLARAMEQTQAFTEQAPSAATVRARTPADIAQ